MLGRIIHFNPMSSAGAVGRPTFPPQGLILSLDVLFQSPLTGCSKESHSSIHSTSIVIGPHSSFVHSRLQSQTHSICTAAALGTGSPSLNPASGIKDHTPVVPSSQLALANSNPNPNSIPEWPSLKLKPSPSTSANTSTTGIVAAG